MQTNNRIIGIGMVAAGVTLFALAIYIEPYMATLSGYARYIVAIPTAILLGISIARLLVYGMVRATGQRTEGGK